MTYLLLHLFLLPNQNLKKDETAAKPVVVQKPEPTTTVDGSVPQVKRRSKNTSALAEVDVLSALAEAEGRRTFLFIYVAG